MWQLLLSVAILVSHVKADQFNALDDINNFVIRGSEFYVATPSKTYLLDSSLKVKYELSKNFIASSFLYTDSNITFECGIRNNTHDKCCFLTNSTNLLELSSNSSDYLCDQFQSIRHFYPCYNGKDKLYLIVSFFKYNFAGAFVRLWFEDILTKNQLSFSQVKFNTKISDRFRAKVLSPASGMFEKYVVIRKSNSDLQAFYMNPDLDISPQNLYGMLKCDGNSTNVHLGFGIIDHSTVVSGISLQQLTHFVMFQSGKHVYKVCSYSEDTEMKINPDSTSLVDIDKTPLINIMTNDINITAFNGISVNGGLAVFYSAGPHLYKLVLTDGDRSFRELGVHYTAESEITKIQFMNENLAYLSTKSNLQSFLPSRCDEYSDCHTCTQLKDPHCGWCTLENRCSVKSDCTIDPALWSQDQCLTVSVDKDGVDFVAGQTLTLDYENISLPQDLHFTCKFTSDNGEMFDANSTVSDSHITCAVPTFTDISDGLLPVRVGLCFLAEELVFVNIDYHQCNLYRACDDCSAINEFCSWCPLEGTCSKHESAPCSDYKVTDSGSCPRINSTQPEKLSSVTIKQVIVDVVNLPAYQISNVYQCRITSKINSTIFRSFDISQSHSTNTSIFCNNVEIDSEFPEYHVNESDVIISIIYRAVSPVVNVVSGPLPVYSCGLLATDCVQCVSKYSIDTYGCRFCGRSCAYSNSAACENKSVKEVNQCFTANTQIEKIIPSWGPGEGGIAVTISGTSLAQTGQNIEIEFVFATDDDSEISVACLDPTIRNSTTLECRVPNFMAALKKQTLHEKTSALIRLDYGNSGIATHTSNETFTIAPLQMLTVFPTSGPVSGGTLVTVTGDPVCNMDQTHVMINNQDCTDVRCTPDSRTLTFRTPLGSISTSPVEVRVGDSDLSNHTFSYESDPIVTGVKPNCTLAVGGMNVTVSGRNFNLIQNPLLVVNGRTPNRRSIEEEEGGNSDTTTTTAARPGYEIVVREEELVQRKASVVECGDAESGGFRGLGVSPVLKSDTELVYTLPEDMSQSYSYGFKMDNVESLCTNLKTMEVITNPSVISINFEKNNTLTCQRGERCYINITMTQIHRFDDQVEVIVGKMPCINASISVISRSNGEIGDLGRFVCVVPTVEQIKESQLEDGGKTKRSILGQEINAKYRVRLQISNYRKEIGWVVFMEGGFPMKFVYIGAGALLFLVLIIIISLAVKNWKDKRHMIVMEKKHQKEIDKVEASYAKAARQEFTELTLMTDHTAKIKIDPLEIPYRIFSDYLVHIMFPNVDKRKIMSNLQLDQCEESDYQLQEFFKFLRNDQFVVKFIDVIEKQREFQIAHRCEVASYLTIALYSDFNYLSHVLFLLLDKIIAADVNKSPKLLLRATKSVAEKLLTNWLSLALHNYLHTITGPPLYELCYNINVTVELGPLDFVTHQARFALSQDRILSEEMEYKVLEVEAEGPDGTRAKAPVSVLDCDTITQVKGKLYRAIYAHQPFSQQPSLDSLSLVWTPSTGQGPGNMELSDFDDRMSDVGVEKRFNTLKSYKVSSNDLLKLTLFNDYHHAPMSTIRSAKRQTVSEICRYHLVKGANSEMDFRSPAPNKRNTNTVTSTKIASEAFLPSLIRTKGHLSKALDSMMNTIFMESNNIPAAIKYLFDYLDEKTVLLAERDRGDAEIAHVWKTNSLPLRFWINIIKNPQFLFDIEKPPIMDSYLSVIGQCFMDSFSLATMTLNKDSSANKLVYNREVSIYRSKVDKWYKDVKQSPKVCVRTVTAESKLPAKLPFSSKFAVSQLYKYAQKYQAEIGAALPTQGQNITRSDFEVLMKPR